MNRAQRRADARAERRGQTPTPRPPRDTRIAYGARCTWWGSIHEVGKMPGTPGLPCCPHCKGVLYELPDEAAWWAGVDKYEAEHPGYRAMIEWARGRCFANFEAAQKAYEAARGGATDD